MTQPLAPPIARIQRTETRLHTHMLVDDYAWLREKDSPEVHAYLEAENAYTEAVMADTAPLQAALYNELLSHIKQTDVSVPAEEHGYWYYTRTSEGAQYPVYCRKPGTRDTYDAAPEQIVLDVEALARDESFMAIGGLDISDDGTLAAYSTDTKGFRQYTLQIKDLGTGELLPESRSNPVQRVGSMAWAADQRTLFYTVEDEEQKRQHRLYRHTAGTPHAQDTLVLEEPDERFNLGAGRTRDGLFIVVESGSHTSAYGWLIPAGAPQTAPRLVTPQREGVEYYTDHRHGRLYIRTNDAGRNFRLVTTPADTPQQEHWQELIAHRDDVMLEDVSLFAGFAVASERRGGLEHLRILRLSAPTEGASPSVAREAEIAFPEPAYSVHLAGNRTFSTNYLRYAYQSLVTPSSVYEYELSTGSSTLLKEQEVPGGFDRTLYASERIAALAPDGTRIPISLVYRRDKRAPGDATPSRAWNPQLPSAVERPAPGTPGLASEIPAPSETTRPHPDTLPSANHQAAQPANPLHIYGYGSYGYSLPLGFNSNRLALLDRGFVLAYAHIRGGGDLGKPWHDAGRLAHKNNTFTDFVAVTEHLLAEGYGDPARVAIQGGSAGGLLMGAVVNLRPELFRAVLSQVPFVDVMNTMLDASLPLTVPEYEEWGNPNERAAFETMLSYSPYDNLRAASYPAMLVKTSLYDSQVMYWEPAKYVAKLRTLNRGSYPILLHTNMTAGHGGASGRYDYLKEIAFDYAFLLRELGVQD